MINSKLEKLNLNLRSKVNSLSALYYKSFKDIDSNFIEKILVLENSDYLLDNLKIKEPEKLYFEDKKECQYLNDFLIYFYKKDELEFFNNLLNINLFCIKTKLSEFKTFETFETLDNYNENIALIDKIPLYNNSNTLNISKIIFENFKLDNNKLYLLTNQYNNFLRCFKHMLNFSLEKYNYEELEKLKEMFYKI